MTAVGFTTARESDYRVHGGIAKEKVKPLLAVSADSRDSVERIRQTPSGESASRDIADGVCEIRSQNDSCIWIDQSKDAASPTRCIRAYPPLSHRLKEFRDGAS